MKIIADTNVLVRAIAEDDDHQTSIAQKALRKASLVAVTLPVLCEFVWVMSRAYKEPRDRIARAIRGLLATENVAVDHAAVEAGLACLDAGGDFADGIIAHEGQWLGGEMFVSFDKRAVALLQARGEAARELA